MWAFSGLAHGTDCTAPPVVVTRALYTTSAERKAMPAIQKHTAAQTPATRGKSDGQEVRLVPIAPTADFCSARLMETGCGKCRPEPRGLME